MTTKDELRERIKGATKRHYATVETPGGDRYMIRSLTMRERGENELIPVNTKTATVDTSKMERQRCDLLCRSVVDDDSKEPVFDTSEWQVWQDVSASVTAPLLKAIDKLNDGENMNAILGN